MNYFDAVNMFEKPMLDQNAIRHLVYHLQDKFDQKLRRLWTDHEYHLIERFMHMHKPCGMYAQLIVTDETREDREEEEISFVRGYQKEAKPIKKVTTKLRTRK